MGFDLIYGSVGTLIIIVAFSLFFFFYGKFVKVGSLQGIGDYLWKRGKERHGIAILGESHDRW